MPGEFWLQFPRVIGEGQLDDPTPPGWPLWRTTYLCTTMLSKWPWIRWISRCGDYWQQAELRTDGACRIMMMMMIQRELVLCLFVQDLFQQTQNAQQPSANADVTKSLPEADVENQLSKLPRPDVAQMLPFKPKMLVRKFAHAMVYLPFHILVCVCVCHWRPGATFSKLS